MTLTLPNILNYYIFLVTEAESPKWPAKSLAARFQDTGGTPRSRIRRCVSCSWNTARRRRTQWRVCINAPLMRTLQRRAHPPRIIMAASPVGVAAAPGERSERRGDASHAGAPPGLAAAAAAGVPLRGFDFIGVVAAGDDGGSGGANDSGLRSRDDDVRPRRTRSSYLGMHARAAASCRWSAAMSADMCAIVSSCTHQRECTRGRACRSVRATATATAALLLLLLLLLKMHTPSAPGTFPAAHTKHAHSSGQIPVRLREPACSGGPR